MGILTKKIQSILVVWRLKAEIARWNFLHKHCRHRGW